MFKLFVWLVGWLSCVFRRIFHSKEDVTVTGEGLQILTCTLHLWTLCSESSLACHAYYDTGHPFIRVIPEDLGYSHLFPSV